MSTCLASLLAACLLTPAAAPEPGAPVRVLVVTGVDYPGHLWKETTPEVRRLLEQDRRVQVRIAEDPEVLATDLPFQFDVVVLHFRNEKPFKAQKQIQDNLTRLVKDGRGLVLLHFACGAFGDWPGFADLAGRVWDGKNTHDPRGPYAVRITNPKHPIARGMKDFQADDELYIGLTGDRPVEVLAVSRSKVTGKDHPMAFVFDYGKGRVFHTPLGHDVKAFRMPGVAELIRRGTVWAAGREP